MPRKWKSSPLRMFYDANGGNSIKLKKGILLLWKYPCLGMRLRFMEAKTSRMWRVHSACPVEYWLILFLLYMLGGGGWQGREREKHRKGVSVLGPSMWEKTKITSMHIWDVVWISEARMGRHVFFTSGAYTWRAGANQGGEGLLSHSRRWSHFHHF